MRGAHHLIVQRIIRNPEEFIDSENYFSWERYFTSLLISKSDGTYLKYSKDRLNSAYLQNKVIKKIATCLPQECKRFIVRAYKCNPLW